MSYYAVDYSNDLAHHGILGMKWGVRRYQNEDGSLTTAGRLRYYGAGGDRKGYYREKGIAKRYKDTINNVTKHRTKHDKNYKAWVKEDPRNRTGQRSQYELERATAMLGGKKGYADAKYAYEHKKLAKYINRDGSLTLAGKMKYSGIGGKNRMKKDIERDQASPTTSEAARKKWVNTSDAVALAGLGIANRDLIKAGVIARPGNSLKKNAVKTGKYAAKSVIRSLTGRPISALKYAAKASKQATVGTAKAAAKDSARGVLGGLSLAKDYGTVTGLAKQGARYAATSKAVRARNIGLQNKALLGMNDANYYSSLERTAEKERKRLDAANKASSTVKNAYDNAKNTASNIVNKKRKRN